MIKRIVLGLALLSVPAWGQAQLPIQPAATPPSQAASGTFANKPAASPGAMYLATDLGTHGVLLISDGTIWKPASGSAVIAQTGATVGSVTGTNAETLLGSVTVPQGLLSANGVLRITARYTVTNNANNKTFTMRVGATAGTSGTSIYSFVGGNVAALKHQVDWILANSTSSEFTFMNNSTTGLGSGTAPSASYNTAGGATVISFTGTLATSSDTLTFIGYTIEWLEP